MHKLNCIILRRATSWFNVVCLRIILDIGICYSILWFILWPGILPRLFTADEVLIQQSGISHSEYFLPVFFSEFLLIFYTNPAFKNKTESEQWGL